MTLQELIATKIKQRLTPQHFEISNESSLHHVPTGSESHFKVLIVSNEFEGKPLLQRHKILNEVLKKEMRDQIHALALHTLTPKEWEQMTTVEHPSPPVFEWISCTKVKRADTFRLCSISIEKRGNLELFVISQMKVCWQRCQPWVFYMPPDGKVIQALKCSVL